MSSIENSKKFLAAWDVFRSFNHLIPYRSVEMFLMIADNNGAKMATIREFFTYRPSVFHRHVHALTDRGYMKNGKLIPGLGLVMTIKDYDDYRSKRVFLTPKGVETLFKFHRAQKGDFSNV